MNSVEIKTDPKVTRVFDNYPEHVRSKMLLIRELALDTSKEIDGINLLEETLKWGEPSYLTKDGSTLRMDWKSKTADQYAMYFKCTGRLVETFKIIFKNDFHFEGTRAIVFKLNEHIPMDELKICIRTASTYHKIKHLPTLGI